MAKIAVKEKQAKKKSVRIETLSLEKVNYQILGAGAVVIVAGYIALSAQPWDNPIALTLAPILLVLGYLVIVPIGILYKKKGASQEQSGTAAEQA
ncbi:MAG: hypothetical protein HUU02_13705 [Bacteroidetes bacterium]|nr:hypothetical protein [Bacteroidota bacterium]